MFHLKIRSVKIFVKPSDEHIIRIEMSNFTNYVLSNTFASYLKSVNSFPNQQFIRNQNIFRSSRLKPRRWQIYPSVHGSAPIGVKSITTCIQELSAIWKLIVISILMIMSTQNWMMETIEISTLIAYAFYHQIILSLVRYQLSSFNILKLRPFKFLPALQRTIIPGCNGNSSTYTSFSQFRMDCCPVIG